MNKWSIWSEEHRGWWKQNRCGYVNSLIEAGKFDVDESYEICYNSNIATDPDRPEEVPVLVETTCRRCVKVYKVKNIDYDFCSDECEHAWMSGN